MRADRPRVNLDLNAGAPLRRSARAAMLAALDAPGNASSIHAEGRAARRRIEAAREAVAALCGADPAAVTFTSGGSEANTTVLTPDWTRAGRPLSFTRLLVSAVEHPSVLAGGRFPADRVTRVPVDGAGIVDLDALGRLARAEAEAGGRVLASVMAANNETGAVQPLAAAAAAVHAAGGLLHTDAVQWAGRRPIDLAASGADVLTLSSHKIGGPQGAGAIVRADAALAFAPLVIGGGQERSARAGTENAAALAGFGAAAHEARLEAEAGEDAAHRLRRHLEDGLRRVDMRTVIFSHRADRLANTVCFAVPGVSAETAVIGFDLAGIAVSAGAACSSGKVGASHVLAAMGVPPDIARAGIRVSFGRHTRDGDIDAFLAAWQELLPRLRHAADAA